MSKDETAKRLADAHFEIEPSVTRVIRYTSDCEASADEPIKLVEINDDTVPAGILPVFFGPSGAYPYPSAIIEVTSDEYQRIQQEELVLPDGWESPITLLERNGND